MKALILVLFVSVMTFGAQAQEQSSRASVEKLMGLMDVSKMVDTIQGQMVTMFNGMSKEMGISEQERPAFEKHMARMLALMKKEMDWEAFKEPMIDVYVKHFTEQEIEGLITFYSSPLGQGMLAKMPIVMQDSMQISQQLVQKILPQVQALALEMKKDIENSRQ